VCDAKAVRTFSTSFLLQPDAQEFQARRATDQQARINALLLEAIAALASLPRRSPPPSLTARAAPGAVSDAAARHTAHRRPVCLTARAHHRDLPKREHRALPTHARTSQPLTARTRCKDQMHGVLAKLGTRGAAAPARARADAAEHAAGRAPAQPARRQALDHCL